MKIKISANGPYIVSGAVPLAAQAIEVDAAGESLAWSLGEDLHRHPHYALCRCGASKGKPFCDGTHVSAGFDGTESATHKPYAEQVEHIPGPVIGLDDDVSLCSDARFCHRKKIWNLTRTAETEQDVETVRHDACLCPSGRYTAVDTQTGARCEPDFEPSIVLIEDPAEESSGPIWVRGGIAIESADGSEYESRNRVTLCRCGGSSNKPFCDGSHLEIGFKAE